jgi:precorrin-2/cobalt-factor-2 C20-methyltransferase
MAIHTFPIAFISLGPGDPELITLKALKTLQAADLIFCASTAKGAGEERSRSAALLSAYSLTAEVRTFHLPMSKQRKAALSVYRQLYRDALTAQEEGRKVAIAVEGDAGVYASMHYVLELLEADGRAVNQLCGIPSFIAAGGAAHLHLVQQDERLLVMPGQATAEELTEWLEARHTVVLMKLSQCEEMVKSFMQSHPEYQYHYFENVSTPQERHLTEVKQIVSLPFPYFSLMILTSACSTAR